MIIFYIQYILISFLSFLSVLKNKKANILLGLIFFLLFILVAFRSKGVDRDYKIYLQYFELLSGSNINYFSKMFLVYEPCNYFIPLFYKYFFGNSAYIHLTFITFALIGILLKFKALEITNSIFLSILIYITNFYLLHEMTQIRAGISTGLFLISIKYIYERNFAKYLLMILCAIFFHYSSFIFLPLYFLINPYRLNIFMWISVLSVVSLLSICGLTLLNPALLTFIPKIKIYLELMAEGEHNIINIWNNPGFVINLLMTYLLLAKKKVIMPNNKYYIIMVKLNTISLLIYMGCASIPTLAIRASQMLGTVQIVLFPCIVFCFKEKILGYFTIISISLIYFYNHYFRVNLILPYRTWLPI